MKALVFYKEKNGEEISGAICGSAIIREKEPFFLPDDHRRWQRMTLRGVRIDRLGKGIRPEFADRYYNECLTAVHPFSAEDDFDATRWCRDGSLIVSRTAPAQAISPDMHTTINNLIARFSYSMTFKTGDLILIGSPTIEAPFIELGSQNIEIEGKNGFPPMRLKIR